MKSKTRSNRTRTRLAVMHSSYVAIAAVLSLGFFSGLWGSVPQAVRPVLELSAPRKVNVGDPIEILLTLKSVPDVAAYETVLLFDPAAAHYHGLRQRDNDLRSFGRDVGPLGAVELPNGIALGLYSCATTDCVSGAGQQRTQGANGTVKLARVMLVADQPGMLEIKLGATKFVDARGTPVAVDLPTRGLQIQVGPTTKPLYAAPASRWTLAQGGATAVGPLDLTGDGVVSHPDVMEVALEWELTHANEAPCVLNWVEAGRDVNGDGCIDVADLQIVASRYGGTHKQVEPSKSDGSMAPTALTFVVNSTGDDPDWGIGDGVCATQYNQCTLRAAILESNGYPGPNNIHFNIPGTGPHTIQLTKKLPTLNDETGSTTIDGYTQPGAVPNSDPLVSNAVIMIQVEGAGENSFDGFVITTPGHTLRGLAVLRLKRPIWIYGSGAHDNKILGCFVGTNAAGTYSAPALVNLAHGLHIEQGAARNNVGGTGLDDRNVISGNARHGLGIWHEGSHYNVVVNNIVGLSPYGDRRLANRKHAVDLNFGAAYTQVGGMGLNERNVLSGNDDTGVEISHESRTTGNMVVGNYIGTDVSGTRAPDYTANNYTGVTLEDGVAGNIVTENVIGNNLYGGVQMTGFYTQNNQIYKNRIGISLDGTPIPNWRFGVLANGRANLIGPENIIAFNRYAGVKSDIDDADMNKITRNSIYYNGALGIDFTPNATSNPNDPGDIDTGPNEQLNFPELISANPTQVTGTACAGCTVELFITDSGSGQYGEGWTFVGSATADAGGAFTASISGALAGNYITATATDSQGNTSEFSLNLVVSP